MKRRTFIRIQWMLCVSKPRAVSVVTSSFATVAYYSAIKKTFYNLCNAMPQEQVHTEGQRPVLDTEIGLQLDAY